MLEAVGAEYLATFFEACDRALRPGGRLGLQVITFPDAAYDAQLRGANWIQTYIFPGGLCPSLAVIERATRDTRLLDHRRRRHRARTTRRPCAPGGRGSWIASTRSGAQGFDERFIRMWEYYLALSEAGFATGISQDLQITMERRRGG